MLICPPIEIKLSKIKDKNYSFCMSNRFFYITDDFNLLIYSDKSEFDKKLKWLENNPESKRNIKEHYTQGQKQRWVFFFIENKVYFMNIQYKKSKVSISELLQTRYTYQKENKII